MSMSRRDCGNTAKTWRQHGGGQIAQVLPQDVLNGPNESRNPDATMTSPSPFVAGGDSQAQRCVYTRSDLVNALGSQFIAIQ